MQKYIYKILPFFILLLAWGLQTSIAQVKVQVVSRTISQSIQWEEGISLELTGERAEIYCTTHSSNTIDFEVSFITKHLNKEVAEEDLKKMQWVNEKLNNKIFLRNYIELKRNESKPESDIKVIYHIKIPEGCALDIKNYFGKIKLENINAEFHVNAEFTGIELLNTNGLGYIKSTFGDITGQDISGELHIESNRSDIKLSNISGKLDLEAVLAEVNLSSFNTIKEIKIDAEKSRLKLKEVKINSYSILLDLTKVETDLPEFLQTVFIKNKKDEISGSYKGSESQSVIDIKLNIGSLTIEQ